MADNVTVDNGALTDYVTSTDEGVGGHVQRVKLAYSADGSETHISADADGLLVNLGANNDVAVTSVVPGTGATNLGKAEDAAHTTGDVGVMMLAVRNDAGGALAGTTGDYIPLNTTSNGSVRVWVEGLPNSVDAVAGGSDVGITALAVRDDALATLTPIDGDYTHFRTNSRGAQWVEIDAVTGATSAYKAVDAAAGASDVGTLVLAVRDDALATLTPVDNDYTQIRTNARGAQWVCLDSTAAQTVTLAAGTATNEAVGDVAEDAALAGNPLRQGVRAHSGVPTAMSADNDIVTPWADRSGAQAVIPQPRTVRVTATPTIATSGYAANDFMGAALTFTSAALASGRAGQVVQAVISSRTVVANALELWLFEASPTIASADSAAFDITDANLEAARVIGVVDFAAANWKNSASNGVCIGTVSSGPVNLPFVSSGSANIFGALIARTVAGQYAGTTDLVVALTVNQF